MAEKESLPETTHGLIMDIDHFAVHDGPGIRTSVYFKGCPLACKWCHSPESQTFRAEILYADSRCARCGACSEACPLNLHILDEGRHIFIRKKCVSCGNCLKSCPSGALFLSARYFRLDELFEELASDKIFFDNSGGGVTLSGGEVLMQAAFASMLLKKLKACGIHAIVETSGYGKTSDLLLLAEDADVFYYDFKLSDKSAFKVFTGGSASIVLENLEILRAFGASVTLRVPLIPGITDSEENVLHAYGIAQRLNLEEVHLLPYNASSGAKYAWLDRQYLLGEISQAPDLPEKLAGMAPKGLSVAIAR
ncbi:MAG: glycyl-radical enzyme activating protein [Clostridiales bacterium]|jgi:pyruvate formate lyase activating enzyme|nr:glycyl-radical enzyme activating protein [Clostridiales bacterium]